MTITGKAIGKSVGYDSGAIFGGLTAGVSTIALGSTAVYLVGVKMMPEMELGLMISRGIIALSAVGTITGASTLFGIFRGGDKGSKAGETEGLKFDQKFKSGFDDKTKKEIEFACQKEGAIKGIEEGLQVALVTAIPIILVTGAVLAASALWSYYHSASESPIPIEEVVTELAPDLAENFNTTDTGYFLE